LQTPTNAPNVTPTDTLAAIATNTLSMAAFVNRFAVIQKEKPIMTKND
jgi:hypothetical protein